MLRKARYERPKQCARHYDGRLNSNRTTLWEFSANAIYALIGLIIAPVEQAPKTNLRTRLRRFFLWTVAVLIGTAALTYTLDFAAFRIRVAMNWNPYGSVTVNHYTAVLQKNGKTNLTFDPPQPWTCVNALISHSGSLPCWYLTRHPDQRTDI